MFETLPRIETISKQRRELLPYGAVVLAQGAIEPEDVAEVVLFLASDAARYMCGSLVEVNGGKPVA